ncbi:hypothetical protein ACKWTF_011692 [Chironomus riparius]
MKTFVYLLIVILIHLSTQISALPTNYLHSNNNNYKTNSIGFTPTSTPTPDTDDFTTEYSQENFDDDYDLSAAAIATLAG